MSVADAIRSGSTESENDHARSEDDEAMEEEESLFVPETKSATSSTFGADLNPQASSFMTQFGQGPTSSTIGKATNESPFGKPAQEQHSSRSTGFGGGGLSNTASAQPSLDSTFGKPAASGGFGTGSSATSSEPFGSTPSFGKPTPASQQQTIGSGFGGFGVPTAPSTSFFGQSAPVQDKEQPFSFFPASTPPVTSIFGLPAQEQKKQQPFGFSPASPATSQPAAPAFGQTTPAPSTRSTASFPPIFSQTKGTEVPFVLPATEGKPYCTGMRRDFSIFHTFELSLTQFAQRTNRAQLQPRLRSNSPNLHRHPSRPAVNRNHLFLHLHRYSTVHHRQLCRP